MSNNGLIPNYTDVDFQTLTTRLKVILGKTETFKDYDFEGANITIIMELLSYIGDLNTFYTNRLAQNIHPETADIYEVVHSLSRQQGYVPSGYVSSEVTLTVSIRRMNDAQDVRYFDSGDQITIPQWYTVDTGLMDADGNSIYYCMVSDYSYTCPDVFLSGYDAELGITYEYVQFDIKMRQGEPLVAPLVYTGEDIISNSIVLPFIKYDMGTYPFVESNPVTMTVGNTDEIWTRVSDFFDDISGLSDNDNVYLVSYDKYKRTIVSFTTTRNIPSTDDEIKLYMVKTLGSDGAVAANTFGDDNKPGLGFLVSSTTGEIPVDRYTVVNTSASVGGSDPETIDDLKVGGNAYSHSQLRNVTKYDYRGNLESRGDIIKSNAWGEQEQNPGVLDTTYYNRAYLSVIPTEWDSEVYTNIKMEDVDVDDDFSNNTTLTPKTLLYPINYTISSVYNPTWEEELLVYLEPRKMLGIWEEFILPELIYFRLDFGLKVKRVYNWTAVRDAVKNKLAYYFLNSNRTFGEQMDFREIYNYIVDMSNVSPTDDFVLVRGIQSLVIRDMLIHRDPSRTEGALSMDIFDDNIDGDYPHFVDTGYSRSNVDDAYNVLQPIQLGHNQFPVLALNYCIFVNEG